MSDADRMLWDGADVDDLLGEDAPDMPSVPRELFPRPTGLEIFESKSKAEQDEILGPKAAELVRTGQVGLRDLVGRSRLKIADDFITQRGVE